MNKSEAKKILKRIDNYNQKISQLVNKLEEASQTKMVEDLRDNGFDNPADAEPAIGNFEIEI